MKLSKKVYLVSVVIIVSLLLVSCIRKEKEEVDTYYIIGEYKINIEELFGYRDSYVGNNSAVGNIIDLSPGSGFFKKFALQTDLEPYGVKVTYGVEAPEDNDKYQSFLNDHEALNQIVLNNASVLFSLVKNVEQIEWYFEGKNDVKYTITRKQMQEFYGEDIRTLAEDQKKWKKKIVEDTLNEYSRIEAFYNTYPQTVLSQQEGEEAITLYFGDTYAESLIGEMVWMLDPTPQKAVEELIKGPKNESLYRTMPDDVKVIDVSIVDGIANINFSQELGEALNGNYGTSAASQILLYSIVNTLTLNEIFEIDQVKILVEGQDIELGPFGILEPQGPDLDMIRL